MAHVCTQLCGSGACDSHRHYGGKTIIEYWVWYGLSISFCIEGRTRDSNNISAGASLVTLMIFGDQLAQFIQSYTLLETSLGAINRLKAFSEKVKPESRTTEDIIPDVSWPHNGEITIKNVSASYM